MIRKIEPDTEPWKGVAIQHAMLDYKLHRKQEQYIEPPPPVYTPPVRKSARYNAFVRAPDTCLLRIVAMLKVNNFGMSHLGTRSS
jgi:hypothetical protein